MSVAAAVVRRLASAGNGRLALVEISAGAILSAIAVALAARFGLSAGGLWRDEVSTVNLALRPTYRQVFESLYFDSAPALYPSLLRLWNAAGWPDQDAALRIFGFVVTCAALVTVWISARALGVRVPLLALALFGAHGLVVQTLGSVKPYGVSTLLAVAAFAALAKLALTPGRTVFVAAAILSVASVQAAYQNVAVVLPAAVVLAGATLRRDRRAAALMAAAAGLGAISVVPYVPMLVRSEEWRVVLRTSVSPAVMLTVLEQAFTGGSFGLRAAWIATIALASFVVLRDLRARRLDRLAIVAAAAVVTATLVPFLMRSGRYPQLWHYVHALGIAALALDVTLSAGVRLRWARIAVAVAAAAAILPGAVERSGLRQTHVDEVARQLAVTADRRDLVVVNPWWFGLTFARYYRGDAPWTTLPPIEDHALHRYDLLRARMTSPEPLTPLHRAIVDTLQRGGRVWLVGTFEPFFVSPGGRAVILPPAPAAPSGWYDMPYVNAWATQTGHLVQTSARTWRILPSPPFAIERVSVIVVEGWR